MRITGLRQNSSYMLVFPITAGGVAVASLGAAEFTLFDNTKCTTLHSSTLSSGVQFVDSQIMVPLESSVTVSLSGVLKFELWIEDAAGRPIAVQDGDIEFKPTVTRI